MISINTKEKTVTLVIKSAYPEDEVIRLKRALLAVSRWYNDSESKTTQDTTNFQTLINFHEFLIGEQGL